MSNPPKSVWSGSHFPERSDCDSLLPAALVGSGADARYALVGIWLISPNAAKSDDRPQPPPESPAVVHLTAPLDGGVADVQWDYSDGFSMPMAAFAPRPSVQEAVHPANPPAARLSGIVRTSFDSSADESHSDLRQKVPTTSSDAWPGMDNSSSFAPARSEIRVATAASALTLRTSLNSSPENELTLHAPHPAVVAVARQTPPLSQGEVAPAILPAPNPPVLRAPTQLPPPWDDVPIEPILPGMLLRYPEPPPLGFTGRSGVLPREMQTTSDFVPIEDRWRFGFTPWDRYGKGHPLDRRLSLRRRRPLGLVQPERAQGRLPDHRPAHVSEHHRRPATRCSRRARSRPPAANSQRNPGETDFFGNPNQFVFRENLSVSFDLFHGDAAFKPVDWRIKVTPIFNVNYLDVEELGVVSPDVTKGHTRGRTWFTLEEWFVETKLADLSPNYDFVSLRVGSQPFNSDFRGFIFSDTNRASACSAPSSRTATSSTSSIFDQLEKDTNSDLNTFDDRGQQVADRQLLSAGFHLARLHGAAQRALQPRRREHALRQERLPRPPRSRSASSSRTRSTPAISAGPATGTSTASTSTTPSTGSSASDSLNPLAGQPVTINAQMAAIELSLRSRLGPLPLVVLLRHRRQQSVQQPTPPASTRSSTIPNFAGGQFSYWQRQPIKLFGVNLKQPFSLVPDLRSRKTEGQSNFVNPGLFLANVGMDFDLTPKLRVINNVNFLWFDETLPLDEFTFQPNIHQTHRHRLEPGHRVSPLLNNNCIIDGGIQCLIPGEGFKDLYRTQQSRIGTLFASFLDVKLLY